MAIKTRNVKLIDDCNKNLRREQSQINIEKINKTMKILKQSNNKQRNIWKIKNKFMPKIQSPLPAAKLNLSGQIISNKQELKSVYLEHFAYRMRSRPIMQHLKAYQREISGYTKSDNKNEIS